MATWKKVIVSGSQAVLDSLALDTALPVASGGTGAATLTDGGVLLGSGTGAITALGQATNGQLVIGSTGADPVLATLTGGANITVTNSAGGISIAASGLGSGTVTEVDATGTVNGITLSTSPGGGITTTGTVTLGGALADVTNSQLTNSSVTIGSTSVALGATAASIAGLTLTGVTASGSFSGSFQGDVITDLEDLTAGNGLSGTAYDGNVARTFAVDADGSTLSVGASGVKVADAGITATQIATSVAGAGLAGGAGTALSVGVDDTSIEITGDALNVKALGITNAMLAGSIANAKLANSTMSVGGVTLTLGGTDATPAFDLADATGYLTSNLSGTITNAQLAGSISNDKLAGSIANGKLANSSINFSDGSNNSDISLGGNVVIQGTANEITVAESSGTYTISQPVDVTIGQDLSVARDMTVARNLVVQGTASFASTTDLDVADRFIRMASGSTSTGDGGISIQQTGPADGEAFAYDSALSRWGVTGSFNPAGNTIAPDAFMGIIVEGASGALPTTTIAKYTKKGNIFVGSNQDIYIYS